MNIFEQFTRKAQQALDWAVANPEKAAIVGAVATTTVAALCKFVKGIERNHRVHQEKDLKELYIYDRSLGCYHKLRRPLRPSERVEIETRRQNGEKLSYILAAMGLMD